MKQLYILLTSLFILMGITQQAYALSSLDYHQIEFSVAGGGNGVSGQNTHLVVSPYETDRLKITSVSSSPLWKVGAGYHFFANPQGANVDFHDLYVELNIYHNTQNIKGMTLQYTLPQFNNFIFSAPVTTTRLMLDFKPSIQIKHVVSLYPLVGLGVAWNDMAYHEIATIGSVPTAANSLRRRYISNFAYDIGAGIKLQFSTHLFAAVEYVYSRTSGIKPASPLPGAPSLTQLPVFALNEHSVLVGLNWKL